MHSGYLRYPDVHGSDVVFCADDDLWLTTTSGGTAWRLTHNAGPVSRPKFSPDGTKVAFASAAHGPGDLYVWDRATGDVDRLTFWNTPTTALTWLDDDHVVAASAALTGQRAGDRLYSVALDGSFERLDYAHGLGLAIHPEGAIALTSANRRDSAAWKRYRGGMAGRLWLDKNGDGDWTRLLPDEEAGIYSPNWFGDRLVFAADIGDVVDLPQSQVWSVNADGEDLRQHTHHTAEQGYVRDPRTDGTTLVYHCRGQLYVMDDLDSEPRQLEVQLHGRRPRISVGAETISQWRVDHGCDASLVGWRGAVSLLTHRAGPARHLALHDGVGYRLPRFLGKTGQAIWVSDEPGHDTLEVGDVDGSGDVKRLETGELGFLVEVEPNPAGTVVATRSHDGHVRIVDVETGEVTEVIHEEVGEGERAMTWSPDGRYLVWCQNVTPWGIRTRLACYDTQDKKVFALTEGEFRDLSPSFSADGKYLLFLSARTFDPHYDAFGFDLSFTGVDRPYVMVLAKDTPSPLGVSTEGWRVSEVLKARDENKPLDSGEDDDVAERPDDKASDEGKGAEAQVTCVIDVENIESRILALPVPAGNLRRLRAVKDGVVWMTLPNQRSLGAANVDDKPHAALDHFSFTARKATTLMPKVETYHVDGTGTRLVVVEPESNACVIVPADRKVSADDPGRIAIDTSRLRREIDRRAEWAHMLKQTALYQRLLFWREDLDGVDWDEAVARYLPLVERISSLDDFADIGWEMVGELNTSHAYVSPGIKGPTAGRLGADLSAAQGGVRIDRIIPGESSDPSANSPLLAPGVAAEAGDVITEVNGQPVSTLRELGRALIGKAGQVIELTLRRDDDERRVAVTPIPTEMDLRYHDWVESRRAYVEEHSGGRLGYLHVPDMSARGWAQFYRLLDRAMRHEGVIVDVRFNGGGNTSQLVVERLSRRVHGWQLGRHMGDDMAVTYPGQAARGPVVVVTNEFAGSDGDIVGGAVQSMGIGPVVGVRSWGGTVGIDMRYGLIDGTAVSQPRYATYINGYGWGLENHGVDPDIHVPLTPADWDAPEDLQLDVAIAEALRGLDRTPAATPPTLPPARWGHRA